MRIPTPCLAALACLAAARVAAACSDPADLGIDLSRQASAALSPLEDLPPREGHDPHDDTPQIPAVQALKDTFWRPQGFVTDVCAGGPCTGPQF